jgi:hypothetical protein
VVTLVFKCKYREVHINKKVWFLNLTVMGFSRSVLKQRGRIHTPKRAFGVLTVDTDSTVGHENDNSVMVQYIKAMKQL